jgi:hypothetical protein
LLQHDSLIAGVRPLHGRRPVVGEFAQVRGTHLQRTPLNLPFTHYRIFKAAGLRWRLQAKRLGPSSTTGYSPDIAKMQHLPLDATLSGTALLVIF